MVGRLVRLLEAVVAEPERAIGSLDLLAPTSAAPSGRLERHRARGSLGHSAGAVRRTGRQDARRHGGGVRGTKPNVRRARCALQSAGASPVRSRRRPETVVGLCVERSPAMLIGLIGILKAGGAYLPLDPRYPRRSPGVHARGRRRAGGGDARGAARSAADQQCAHRVPRCRLDRDCTAAGHHAGQRAAAASPRLRHLHVGLRPARPRAWWSTTPALRTARGPATGLRCRERLPVGAAHLQRLRRFDRADGAAADRRRRRGGYQRCDTGAAGAVLGSR